MVLKKIKRAVKEYRKSRKDPAIVKVLIKDKGYHVSGLKDRDLTDLFKGKRIKNPKTFLKERKKVIKEMTKKKAKGGVIKTGIRKAAELKKRMVEAREETLRKSPKGSTLRKISKQFEEHRKLKKYGRGGQIRTHAKKLKELYAKAKKYAPSKKGLKTSKIYSTVKGAYKGKKTYTPLDNIDIRLNPQRYVKGGTVKRKPNKDRYETGGRVGTVGRVGRARASMQEIEEALKGWELSPTQAPKKKSRARTAGEKVGKTVGKVKKTIKEFKEGYQTGKGKPKGRLGPKSIERMLKPKVKPPTGRPYFHKAPKPYLEEPIRKLAPGMPKKGLKYMQEGGQAKVEDPRFTPQAQTFEEADAILDLARKRKPSGVIGQDDINAAREEYNRRKELRRMRQADTAPTPMPKTSKRTLTKPMQKSAPTFTPGPRFLADDPSRDLPMAAGPIRRQEQDRYTIDEGMVIKPTDDYVRRRLGMKEGGSVSSKPKQRGWGKAIKGTKFKGTF